jgi:hypothetical protein
MISTSDLAWIRVAAGKTEQISTIEIVKLRIIVAVATGTMGLAMAPKHSQVCSPLSFPFFPDI